MFTLLYKTKHTINGDYGITFKSDAEDTEQKMDEYTENKLIDSQHYRDYVRRNTGRSRCLLQR